MNFGSNFGMSPSTLNFFGEAGSSTRRKKCSKIIGGKNDVLDITKFLDLSPKKNSKNEKQRKNGIVLELVRSQSNQDENNKRPHSTHSLGLRVRSEEKIVKNSEGFSIVGMTNKRLPDIQMINKYYGLVPKKFTVHSRQDSGASNLEFNNTRKLRAKSAFLSGKSTTKNSSLDEPSGSGSDTECNERPLWNKRGHRQRKRKDKEEDIKGFASPQLCSQNESSLSTRKISVERQRKFYRVRSSSLPLGVPDNLNCHANPTLKESWQQRVIKIDLNSMSWEENCTSSCSSVTIDEVRDSDSPAEQTVMQIIGNSGQKSLSKSSSNTSQSQSDEVDDYLMEQSVKHTFPDAKWENERDNGADVDKSNKLCGSNKVPFLEEISQKVSVPGNVSQVVEVVREGVMGDKNNVELAQSRRGNFKKTISFDDKLTSCGEEKKKSEPKPIRPMTAIPKSPLPQNTPSTKVLPWTQKAGKNMSLSERRGKLQKSVSIHSTESNSSFDFSLGVGEEWSDTETWSQPQVVAPGPNSSAYKETRKALFFQPAPEVTTLVSQISPIETLQIQVEIEKVALLLNNMQNQNKSFIDLTPDRVCESKKEKNLQNDRIVSHDDQIYKGIQGLSPEYLKSCTTKNSQGVNYPLIKSRNEEPPPLLAETIKTEVVTPLVTHYPISTKVSPSPQPRRPLLKKAFSCEQELLGTSGKEKKNEVNGISNNGNKSPRPKTANNQKAPLVRTLSTPSILPPKVNSICHNSPLSSRPIFGKTRTNNKRAKDESQNQATTNRKILIKRALQEINESSVQLGLRKWGVLGRPRTAPNNSSTQIKAHQKRQPLKVSPAILVMAGNKSVPGLGTKVIPDLTMGRKGVNKESLEEKNKEEEEEESLPPPQQQPSKRGTLRRQSFSLDEGMLLSFSNKEFGWASKSVESSLDKDVEVSKKREECLKIYEKMLKTGMNVKLDTIYRGMMVPSEYRTFIKAAEEAARELVAVEEEKKNEMIELEKAKDAGVKSIRLATDENKDVQAN